MTYDPNTTETPTPTPTPQKKYGKWVIIGLVLIIFYAIGSSGSDSNSNNNSSNDNSSSQTWDVPTTISVADEWSTWKSDFMPLVSQTQTDYAQTQADLSSEDLSASLDDFTVLSQDATDWISYNNSPNANVNRLVTAVSVDLQMIASQGVIVLTGDTSSQAIADFQSYCQDFGRDTDALATAIENANNSY